MSDELIDDLPCSPTLNFGGADPGAEDFKWPEVKDLRPSDAVRLLDDIEAAGRAANKRADILKTRKAQAKQIALAVMEEYDQPDAAAITAGGQKVRYTPYPFDVFSVDDEEAFREWSENQSESYFDASPKLRQSIFLDEMRRRHQDGEPMPPGVRRWTDIRLSRSALK
jgi:hypothetical protein